MLKKIDLILLLAMLGLITFSILFVFSSSVDINGNINSQEFKRQILFVSLGLIFFTLLQFVSLKSLFQQSIWIYVFCLLLLIITLIFGEIKNGAKSWLNIFGFGIQGSEFMKIATIIFLAAILDEFKPNSQSYVDIIKYSFVGFIPMGLILLQPDMGTTLVYIPILLGIFFIYGVSPFSLFYIIGMGVVSIATLLISYYLVSISANTNINSISDVQLLRSTEYLYYLAILFFICLLSLLGMFTGYLHSLFKFVCYVGSMFGVGSLLAYVATIVLKPYQLQRLLVFVNPNSDPLGSGWHILQSVTAIGTGGFRGKGFLLGSHTKLEYLPQKSTDFIFSVIGEESGFIGSVVFVFLYLILLLRIIYIGIRSNDIGNAMICSGVAAMFFTHFMVNIGMTLGIMPVTGIPLLLVSYGGSSLVTSLIALALVHRIYIFNNSHIPL